MEKDIILVVDDDRSNLMLARRILGTKYEVMQADSGREAMEKLAEAVPSLILMDINMPEIDGFEAVSMIKETEKGRNIPVIFLTADKDSATENRCFAAGAVDFVTKPFVPNVLLSRVDRTLELENYRKNLEKLVESQTRQLAKEAERIENMQIAVITGMANLIESRDGSTGEHVKNTRLYVRMIVERLIEKGLFKGELDEVYANNIINAAPLHDIGKIRISDNILLKPARLTEEEYLTMQKHTEYGLEIIRSIISDVEDEAYILTAEEIALCHHERWDGKGYPVGIEGNKIPLSARIMAVADVFDALYAERCYKKPVRPVEKALALMLEGRGSQFDADILDTFAELTPELKKFLGETV